MKTRVNRCSARKRVQAVYPAATVFRAIDAQQQVSFVVMSMAIDGNRVLARGADRGKAWKAAWRQVQRQRLTLRRDLARGPRLDSNWTLNLEIGDDTLYGARP